MHSFKCGNTLELVYLLAFSYVMFGSWKNWRENIKKENINENYKKRKCEGKLKNRLYLSCIWLLKNIKGRK